MIKYVEKDEFEQLISEHSDCCNICCVEYMDIKNVDHTIRSERDYEEDKTLTKPLILQCCKQMICSTCIYNHIKNKGGLICPYCNKNHCPVDSKDDRNIDTGTDTDIDMDIDNENNINVVVNRIYVDNRGTHIYRNVAGMREELINAFNNI